MVRELVGIDRYWLAVLVNDRNCLSRSFSICFFLSGSNFYHCKRDKLSSRSHMYMTRTHEWSGIGKDTRRCRSLAENCRRWTAARSFRVTFTKFSRVKESKLIVVRIIYGRDLSLPHIEGSVRDFSFAIFTLGIKIKYKVKYIKYSSSICDVLLTQVDICFYIYFFKTFFHVTNLKYFIFLFGTFTGP